MPRKRAFALRDQYPALIALLLAPLLIYTAVFASALRVGRPSTGWPYDDLGATKGLAQKLVGANVPVSAADLERARRAAVENPLAYEPYIVLGRAAAIRKDRETAVTYLKEAVRRRPNYAPAHLHLLGLYGELRDYPRFSAELNEMFRLGGVAKERLILALGKLSNNAEVRPYIADMLAADPVWRDDYLKAAAAEKLEPAAVRDIIDRMLARNPKLSLAGEYGLYAKALADAGDYRRARALFIARLPEAQRRDSALLYDGRFTGAAAPAPFGWEYFDAEGGRAERIKDGESNVVRASFFGSGATVLARQTLALDPGNYVLSGRFRSAEQPKSGEMSWQISCLPDAAIIARMPLRGAGGGWVTARANVVVPALGCAGQLLSLVGNPGEIVSPIDIDVAQLELRRQ